MIRITAVLLALAAPVLARAADPVFAPGASIGVPPLVGMELSKRFQGFEDPRSGASIAIVEMPKEAFAEVSKGFTDQALAAQGIAAPKRETLTVAGVPGLLISGEQTVGPTTVRKWVLVADGPKATAMVIAQMLKGDPEPYTEEQVRGALTAIAFRDPPGVQEQVRALPFRLGDQAGFRIVRVLGGNSLFMTDGPADTVREVEQPIMIVASSLAGAPPAAERDAFARRAVSSVPGLSSFKVERAQAFRQDNADWHETVVSAKDVSSGRDVVVTQVIRFVPGGYLRILGVTRAETRDAVLPRFRQVADKVDVN